MDSIKIKNDLKNLLNECLESMNQENSFEITSVDMKNKKLYVVFDVVEIPEDDYIGFVGY